MEVTITPAELAAERMSNANLARAIRAICENGYVILPDVIDHNHLDILRERMDADSQKMIDAGSWGGAGHIEGHLQQGPPPFAPYIFRDIVANPFAIQVTSALLGEGVYNRYYNGNANCPGSGTQPLHADGPHLWSDMTTPHPTASVVVNVALMDVTAEYGSTELWPGTHLIPSNERRIDADIEARRRAAVPPIRANTRKGSLLIRDVRLWHRGVPNRANVVRHMIAMIHNKPWLHRPCPLLFNIGCEDAFPDGDFDHNVQFTDQPLQYLFTRYATIKESR